MRLGAFELSQPLLELKEPHALVMLQPWVDVGGVGTLTLVWLETQFKAKEFARLSRPGDFFDFTRYRPTIYVKEGYRQVTIPNTYVTCGQQKTSNDFLFLHLLEPHSHAEMYVESILRLLARAGVKRYCLLGSVYDFVPHTRPLLVTGGAVGKVGEELKKMGIESSDYQGPTSITTLISQRASEMGIETMSLIVHLPQYTQLEEDYTGTVPLMKVLCSLYQLPLDEKYLGKAEQQQRQISQAVDKNPQLRAVVKQLEDHYEARANKKREEEEPKLSPEIERFLAEIERRFRES